MVVTLRAAKLGRKGSLKEPVVRQTGEIVRLGTMFDFLEQLSVAECVCGSAGHDLEKSHRRFRQSRAEFPGAYVNQSQDSILRDHRYCDQTRWRGIRNKQQLPRFVSLVQLGIIFEID